MCFFSFQLGVWDDFNAKRLLEKRLVNQVSLALVDMAKYDFGPPKYVKNKDFLFP